eukprot:gene1378-1816_t
MHVTDWLPTLMGLATENAWTGSVKGNDIDGADQWSSMINDEASAHPEIMLFLDGDGSYVMVKDMIKMTMFNDPAQGMFDFEAPDASFSGESADVTACLYATSSSNSESSKKPLSFVQIATGQSHYFVLAVFALTFLALTWYGIMSLNAGDKQRKSVSTRETDGEPKDQYFKIDENTPLVRTSSTETGV